MILERKIINISIVFIVCMAIGFCSCKKDKLSDTRSGLFFKTLETDSSTIAIKTLGTPDGSFLVVCRDKLHEHTGYAFKISKEGKQVFKKRLSSSNRYLQSVIDLPGEGFATAGHEDLFQQHINVCIYDGAANLITSKQVQLPGATGNFSFFRILQLSNGNYVFAAGNGSSSYGILLFTDGDFNKLSDIVFNPPTGYSGYAINSLCELPGNTIAITGSSGRWGATFNFTSYTNLFVLTTDFSGNQKSFTMLNDTVISETPNCLLPANNNIISVTARSIGLNTGNGLFVDYEFARFGSTISGMIHLNLHDSIGNLLDRKQVTGYPLNGMIQTIKQTSDGGYILCGTVNQSNIASLVSETKIYLLKIDIERNIQWTKIIDTPYPSYGTDVMETDDGGYLITGQMNSINGKFQAMIIKTDASGNIY